MLGFGMMQVVQGVVAFELTGKNQAVGFVALGSGFSMLFLSPVGGALSDRVSKKKMLTLAQGSIGLMFGVIAILIITDTITIWLLAGCSLILGSMFAMMGPTRQAWVGDLLSGPELARGVALTQLTMNGTRIVGPMIAGGLLYFDAIGPGGVYLAMFLVFCGVVGIMTRMEATTPRPRETKTSILADLKAGVHYIWNNGEVRLLTLCFAGIVLSAFSYMTILPGYLENALGHDASQLGFVFGATAVGGIATTLVMSARPPSNTVTAMFMFGGALAGSLFLLAIVPSFSGAMLVAVLIGAASSGFQMLNNVNLMERSDPEFFGRVMSVTMMAFGLNSMAAFPIGILADNLGERAALGGLSVVCLAVVVVGFMASTRVALLRPAPREVTAVVRD